MAKSRSREILASGRIFTQKGAETQLVRAHSDLIFGKGHLEATQGVIYRDHLRRLLRLSSLRPYSWKIYRKPAAQADFEC